MYNWENSAKANRKKAKKTGTVVFHPDETVDLSLDRLLKEVNVSRHHHHHPRDEESGSKEDDTIRSALMTEETVVALKKKKRFTSLLPCQAQCYRGIFNRRDVILHSRTGSGKTLAYALPIIERHLLLEAKDAKAGGKGPFLLIFVFSNDLAVQTKDVLSTIYPKLRIGVAGFDGTSGGEVYDILVGTVRKLDECIRGHKVAAAATRLEEKEKADHQRLLGAHKGGGGSENTKANSGKKRSRGEEEGDEEEDANSDNPDSDADDDADDAGIAGGDVSVANVRAIVIDEVDTTLGPRFSNVGRRMKNLLKFVRKANGSLTEGLLSDFRAHHYVLCGATIPNWVVKAGFLGVKKYYYQLVTVGTEKLPETLTCYELNCPMAQRVEVAVDLLTGPQRQGLGRVIAFGTNKQVTALGAALQKHQTAEDAIRSNNSSSNGSGAGGPDKKRKKVETQKKDDGVIVRTLMPSKDHMERIAAMVDFNEEVASVLLCTDIAARGLDFTAVDTVLMLSVPHGNMAAETFIHRAGRTARVNRKGQCILMCDSDEAHIVDMIMKSAHVVFRKYLPTHTGTSGGGKPSSSRPGAAAAGSGPESTTHYQLTVKNQFRFSRPDVKVPTAREVLERCLGGAGDESLKEAALQTAKEAGGSSEVITFSVPAAVAHEAKQRLWKYSLKEIPQHHGKESE